MINKTFSVFLIFAFASCITIKNRDAVMSLSTIGDSKTLKKNGYYYSEDYIKTNPYYRNEYGGFSRDSTITFDQVRITTLALNENGSAMELGSFSGMQDNLAFNFGIKCDLPDNNTLASAFEHFECYVKKLDDRNLNFINSKAEIWGQGVYKVDNNIITIQTFYNSIGNYQLFEERGVIKNDSTFILTEATDYETGRKFEINKIYKFRKMDNFPHIDNYILKNKKKFN